MSSPEYLQLQKKASLALRQGELDVALAHYRELEHLMPEDADWPERSALIFRRLGRSPNELACLQRALDLHVDAGEVLAAIATCKLILDIEPEHPATTECLHLLYSSPKAGQPTSLPPLPPDTEPLGQPRFEDGLAKLALLRSSRDDDTAPLVDLHLGGMIAGARPVTLGDVEAGGVAEIPLEVEWEEPEDEIVLDVCVEAPPSTESMSCALADIPLFGALEPHELHSLMTNVRVLHVAERDLVFRQGDLADTLYVVVEGAVVPIAEAAAGGVRTRLSVIEKGDFFGEIGLVTNQPRNASIEALVDSRLIAIERRIIWSLIRGRPEMAKVMLRFLRERLIDRQIRTNPFFEPFAGTERDQVARLFRFLEIKSGARLVQEGETPDGLFVLLAGQLDRVQGERSKLLGEHHSGAVFGGLSLLDSGPAGASIVANGKCWVLSLSEARFRNLLESNREFETVFGRMIEGVDPARIFG